MWQHTCSSPRALTHTQVCAGVTHTCICKGIRHRYTPNSRVSCTDHALSCNAMPCPFGAAYCCTQRHSVARYNPAHLAWCSLHVHGHEVPPGLPPRPHLTSVTQHHAVHAATRNLQPPAGRQAGRRQQQAQEYREGSSSSNSTSHRIVMAGAALRSTGRHNRLRWSEGKVFVCKAHQVATRYGVHINAPCACSSRLAC
jgi:hypothetical protein